jgi:hypothetical protein
MPGTPSLDLAEPTAIALAMPLVTISGRRPVSGP